MWRRWKYIFHEFPLCSGKNSTQERLFFCKDNITLYAKEWDGASGQELRWILPGGNNIHISYPHDKFKLASFLSSRHVTFALSDGGEGKAATTKLHERALPRRTFYMMDYHTATPNKHTLSHVTKPGRSKDFFFTKSTRTRLFHRWSCCEPE